MLGTLALITVPAATAHGQTAVDPALPAPPPAFVEEPGVDPLLPAGIAITAVSLAFSGAGGYLVARAEGSHDGRKASGASLLGAGFALNIVGVSALIVGSTSDLTRALRRSPARMMVGLSLGALGAGAMSAGVGLFASGDRNVRGVAAVVMAAGGGFVAGGLPALLTGAARTAPAPMPALSVGLGSFEARWVF